MRKHPDNSPLATVDQRTSSPGTTVQTVTNTGSRVERVLAGDIPYDELTATEQAQIRPELDRRVTAARLSLNLAEEFIAHGEAYCELDEHGNVVQRNDAHRS
jgi:hypothetical protein